MRKELFETGKTVDIAIDSACEKLGCLREDCEWEIIDLPRKSFLGLKNTPAKVRVSIETPDEKPEKKPVEEKPEKKSAPYSEPRPVKQAAQRVAEPVQEKRPGESAPEPAKPEAVKTQDYSDKEKLAMSYLTDIIGALGLKADYAVTHEHDGSCINIVGEGLGMIIGRRGETLDAIQYLTGLVANRGEGDYLRLTVDCGDYRIKRKSTLESLARKLANQVIKTNVSKVLEPMNPFERRVIHATVSEIEGVSSSSVGDEPNRRVVITSPTARPAPPRGGARSDRRDNRGPRRDSRQPSGGENRSPKFSRDGAERGGGSRDDRRRGDERRPPHQSPQINQGPPKQTPESEATTGVSFGKIELE